MGLSSLSPANSACLTTSLSRRLSLKNVSAGPLNSPMFGANGGRKRSGSRHESKHVEPSSPKVTCIGQVRVKTRKHVKKTMRARSKREGGQTSLRRSSSDQNDGGGRRFDGSENRWVHLPVTICELLRALNCLFPCRSSCTDDDTHRVRDRSGGNSCGAVFTRWFVAVEETGGIELVVGGGGDDAEEDRRRRHVFENLDLSFIETKTVKEEIVGPPKNALLLMRCRSDPVKVAALANRVRERQMSLNDVAYCSREEEEDNKRIELCEKWISDKTIAETEVIVPVSEEEASKIQDVDSYEEETEAMIIKTIEDDIRKNIEEEECKEVNSVTLKVARSDQGIVPDPGPEVVMKGSQLEEATDKEKTTPYKVLPDCLLLMMCEPKLSMEVSKETWVCSTDFVRCQPERPPAKKIKEPAGDHQLNKRIVTAVGSNVSSRPRSVDKPPVHQPLLQPPRSSCSYPAAPPLIQAVAAVGEQKIVGAKPPVLPRCNWSRILQLPSELAPPA
ncbi:hypothetical protein Bca4012_090703 [Brassica carinata]